MKQWSLNACSKGQPWPLPIEGRVEAGKDRNRQAIEGSLCARGTRTIGMCSFDARSGDHPQRPRLLGG